MLLLPGYEIIPNMAIMLEFGEKLPLADRLKADGGLDSVTTPTVPQHGNSV